MQKQQKKPMTACGKTKKYFWGPVALEFVATKTGVWRSVRPDVNLAVCVFCGNCGKHCPADIVSVEKEKRSVSFDWDYCKGCGICANVCPKQCITMIPEEGVCKL